MKILKFKVLVVLFASLAMISGCNDDPEEVVSQFVGNYTITNAAVAETFTLYTSTPGVTVPVQAGTDITTAIQNSLLSSASCTSADKAWVELRKDNSMYMSCEGANAFNAGTWEEVDATTLKLNMNSAAIPSSPTGYVLTVSNVTKTATGLTGKTSVPMPKEMFAAGLAAFGMTIADTPAVYMPGAALLGTLVTSVAGVGIYYAIGIHPDLLLGALFGVGGFGGMYIGARLQKFVSGQVIRIGLGVVISGLALRYIAGFFLG